MEEGNKNLNKKGVWWSGPMQVFSEISTWIAAPIILAVIAGKALDERYSTEPWFLLGLMAFSFLISSYGIIKAVKKYAKKIKREEKNYF